MLVEQTDETNVCSAAAIVKRHTTPTDVAARLIWWSLGVWLVTRALDVIMTAIARTGTVSHRAAAWMFWDAYEYTSIATQGYPAHSPYLAAYFPFYPLLAHGLLALHIPSVAALLLVSNVASLVAFILIGLLVWRETYSERAAIFAILVLAVSPSGVFLSAQYSDSLFLALAAGALLTARTGHWRWAGLMLALSLITRAFGGALALALAVEYIHQHRQHREWRQWRSALWLVMPSMLTLGSFLALLWRIYGSPFITFQVEALDFGHVFRWPWQTIALAAQQFAVHPPGLPEANMLLDATPVLFGIVVVALRVRHWPPAFTVYVACVAWLCLTAPILSFRYGYALVSDGRYSYAAAPLLLIPIGRILASWRWPLSVPLLATSLAGQLTLVALLLHGGWLV